MTKEELRKEFLQKRKTIQNKSDLDRKIFENFFSNFSVIGTQIIHIYQPIQKFVEIDTALFINEFRKLGHTVAVPKIDDKQIQNFEIDDMTKWEMNKWGILEPIAGKQVNPELMDMVIVPLLAYDKSGHRVGYGKGFYDRLLFNCRPDCLKVGLSYFPPVEKIEGINQNDIPLDYCVTPESVFEF